MIIGHQKQTKFLSEIATTKKIPHALIFEGISKLGKRTVAMNFIKHLFCEQEETCYQCCSCSAIDKGTHPDLFLIFPQKKEIQLSQIKELSRRFSLKPYLSSFKAAIIDEAHLMNSESQNSILKILEEPTGDSVIILVSGNPESLLPTVRSRSQRIKFFPVNPQEIRTELQARGGQGQLLEEIVLFSFGRPGLAIDFLLEPEKINYRREKIKEILQKTASDSPLSLRFQYAKELSTEPEKAKELLEIWLSYFRILMLKKIMGTKGIGQSLKRIKNSILRIEEASYLISKTNANLKLVLESLIVWI